MFMYYNITFVIKYCTYHKISEIKNEKYFSTVLKLFNKTAPYKISKNKYILVS